MGKTLLLVDDSPTICNIIKVYLMGEKLEILEAADGERALQILKLTPVNLVIADINMPGMDGITLLKRIRGDKTEAVSRLPVVLLTGDKSPQLKEQGTAAGASEFLYKPVTQAALMAVVRKVLPG